MENKINPNADLDLMSKNELHEEHTRLTGLLMGTLYNSNKYHAINKRADLVCEKLGLGVLNDKE